MSDNPAAPSATGTPTPAPDPTQTPAPDPAEIARLRQELQETKTREGRLRTEKGIREARLRELEALYLSGGAVDPTTTYTNATDASGMYGRPYSPNSPDPRLQRIQDNQDDLKLRWELGKEGYDKFFPKAVEILNDPIKGPEFLARRDDGTTDYYRSVKAAVREMELQELRAKLTQPASPSGALPSNPQAVISGVGAAAVAETMDLAAIQRLADENPDEFKKQFGNLLAGGLASR